MFRCMFSGCYVFVDSVEPQALQQKHLPCISPPPSFGLHFSHLGSPTPLENEIILSGFHMSFVTSLVDSMWLGFAGNSAHVMRISQILVLISGWAVGETEVQ